MMNCPICGYEHRPSYVRFTLDDAQHQVQAYVRPAVYCRNVDTWFVFLRPAIMGIGVDMIPLKRRDVTEVNPATIKPEDIAPPEPVDNELPEELL